MPPALDPRLQELLARTEDLPSLPAVALEVLRLCRAEDATLDDLAKALSTDPALAARLLRFANSSLYGSGEEVRTLQRATLVLGMKTVQLMSLSFSLVGTVPRASQGGAYDFARYWQRSLVRAVSARALAGLVGLPAQDEAFLAGLLGEIGQVVMARSLAELYEPVLREAARTPDGWPDAALERERLGFDHHDVGAALLSSWGLPRVLAFALRHAGDPDTLPGDAPAEFVPIVRVLALAACITDLFTLAERAPALERVHTLARRWFARDATEMEAFLGGLEAPVREAAGLLELSAPPPGGHARVLDEARAELVRLSLGQTRQLESLRLAVDPGHRARLAAEPAHVDGLTGCANELALQRFLEHELTARLDGNLVRPLGLFLLAIDAFGSLPSEAARAEVQRALAGCLTRLTRKHDLVARLAPGRFAVLLGDSTPYGQRALAERIRQDLLALELVLGDARLRFSAALGGAALAAVRRRSDGAALFELAERLLERARRRGPGQVEVCPTLLQPR